MSSSCDAISSALKTCLLESDCVVKQGYLPSQCLKEHMDELPEQCQSLRKAMFECKRNMLDMRKRFRGNTVGMDAAKLRDQQKAPTQPIE
ncbi:cytochrome c oxidase assembly protein PET191-domain-containing protein [Hygrophoropsis aurantiaca]|uniref:Cytochrome c oxidase assembly protein PET191-domain-containing protein n=1 Tax=Hygrophoropsis aurantiaca TaxID=72124 RepID=A0ACB8A704_9AGAM|nr:cytochrome c oxidase assembly protein PET191-domain-containing protein [Hygrophoropsis aurantiaca]